jgi:GNAT superfamily N-acetyltransferase
LLERRAAMKVRLALPSDTAAVSGVLDAAAAHLRNRGQALWTQGEVSESAVAPHVRGGLYYLGHDGEDAVGVFRLQLEDPSFWPEMADGTSTYLHKLAVVPARQGRGIAQELLGHAVWLTREKGLRFLRLDCMAGRPRLVAVYESFGFRHHSDKQIGGQVFHRFEFDVGRS